MTVKCPDCGFVMPLGPSVYMTWCPCGWRQATVVELTAKKERSSDSASAEKGPFEEAA